MVVCRDLASSKVEQLDKQYEEWVTRSINDAKADTKASSPDQNVKKGIVVLKHDMAKITALAQAVKAKKLQALRNMAKPNQSEVKENTVHEVINLSKKVLSEEQISLLSKGLNFVPTKKTPLTLLIAELQE